jgi:hypothetical protein
MSDLYTYRDGVLPQTTDLTGFDVEATDGSIGKIDEASYETSASCMVVDTGFWIFGKKRLIPAAMVQQVDVADGKVYVAMTKDQIKDAPDFDPELHRPDEPAYREEVGRYYSNRSS